MLNNNRINKFYWLLAALFSGIYFWMVCQYTYNIPCWDDFDVFFRFLCDYNEESSFAEKFKLLLDQHNVHRIVPTKFIGLMSYWTTGGVNLSFFILIGNLFLLGIGIMFFMYVREKKEAGMFMLLTVLLLFNGQNLETSTCTWAMASIANAGSLLLAMLSIYFVLQKDRKYFVSGIVLSVITVFSNGNGMCLLPAVTFSLFLMNRRKELMLFSIVIGIAVASYFIDLRFSAGTERNSIPDIAVNFLHFLGGNFWLPSAKIFAFCWGLFVCFTYVFAFVRKSYKTNIVWFSFFTFMLLTAAMVALNRPYGEVAALRYRIYCCMPTILTIMFYYENRKALHLSRWFKYIVTPVMLFSIFSTLLYSTKHENNREFLRTSTYNWQRDKSGLSYFNTSGTDIVALKRAESAGIYTMPVLPMKELESEVITNGKNVSVPNISITYHIDYVDETSDYLLIKGWAYTEEMSMDFTDIFLWLRNGEENIKIVPYAERRYDVPGSLNIRENCGFFAAIPKARLPKGSYNLCIEIQKRYIVPVKKSAKYADTDQQISIN